MPVHLRSVASMITLLVVAGTVPSLGAIQDLQSVDRMPETYYEIAFPGSPQ